MKFNFKLKDMLVKAIKYFIMAIMVGLACVFIPSEDKKLNFNEVVIIALVASVVFALLDIYSPSVIITNGSSLHDD